MSTTASATNRFPPQIPYILGNEACERFSFYGMKNILTFFMINFLLLKYVPEKVDREAAGKATYHLFVSACYFFPIFGGFLADRFLGKYRTILYLSLFYCVGHGLLAVFEDNKHGFYAGLFFIAVGSGGIKPCVATFVGDQFDDSNKHLVKKVFGVFYWLINFGSFFATLITPALLALNKPSLAFGLPGVLMGIATFVFWLGRHKYRNVPPVGSDPHTFLKVVTTAVHLRSLSRATEHHPDTAVDGVRAILRLLPLFLPIAFFWLVFDQKGSTWVVQATQMHLPTVFGNQMQASQMLILNPLMVMLLVPFTQLLLYPYLERKGVALTALRRIAIGMFIAAAAFLASALIQFTLDDGRQLHIAWQGVPYFILTLAEVLVSTTMLEFAYSQAPHQMKGTVMGMYNLMVTVGNLAAAGILAKAKFSGGWQFVFFASLVVVGAVIFAFLASRYTVREFFQPADLTQTPPTQPSERTAPGMGAQ